MRSTFCILLICGLLSACSQIRYIGIETFSPADITYPQHVKKILIVNNAVPQPSDSGYEYSLLGMLQDTCRIHADSAIFSACKALGETIVETDFFQDVLLFHENTRTDTAFLIDKKLTQTEVISLCEETGADAIISFDRLLFDMNKNVSKLADGYLIGLVDIKLSGIVRSYLPSRENPLGTILAEDSIFWAEDAPTIGLLNSILPTADEALKTAGEFIGNKVYTVFVPHWSRDVRWYYTDITSRWKEASSYAAGEKWDSAFERWSTIYEKSSGWKSKAKAAANMALYYELNSDMTKAYKWAEKADELFKTNTKEDDKSRVLQSAYKNILLERIRDDRKLNMQFGEE